MNSTSKNNKDINDLLKPPQSNHTYIHLYIYIEQKVKESNFEEIKIRLKGYVQPKASTKRNKKKLKRKKHTETEGIQ